MADQSQKTEQPTQRKLTKSREQGQFPVSRELLAGVQFMLFVALVTSHAVEILETGRELFRGCLQVAFGGVMTPIALTALLRDLGWRIIKPVGILLFMMTLLPLAAQVASTQFGVSFAKLKPDFHRFNPVQRITGMAAQNVAAALMALVALTGAILLMPIFALSHQSLLTLPLSSLAGGLARAGAAFDGLLWKGGSGLLLLGIADYLRQRKKWQQGLRMSKQEIRDEHKESDGSPEMKMRLRRIRRDLLRKRMMKDVATATAIITNPTHFAVAIRYDMTSMTAPLVVAKGKNYLALRIRQKAKDLDIPIVENPPLAQALYKSVDVGQEIPPHLYRAVAEILAYIFRLMNGRFPK